MARRCGECTLCCKLLPVRELDKPANTRCKHQSTKGCAVYHRDGMPPSCELWSCRWLVEDDTADQLRPDRSGYVLDIMPDIVRVHADGGDISEIDIIQVWVDPGRDVVNDKRLRQYAERQAEHGAALLLRDGSARGKMIFAPRLASDGKWHIVGDELMKVAETVTGNLMLDRLKGLNDGTPQQ